MKKVNLSLALVVVPAALLMGNPAANASNWQRFPMSTCISAASTAPAATVTGVNLDSAGTETTSGGSTITDTTANGYAYCPFVQTSELPAGNVTTLSVDLYNPTNSTESQDQLFAATCVYSSWSESCSVGVLNPSITAGSHASLSFSLSNPPVSSDTLYFWYEDGSSGYAYIELTEEGSNPGNFLAGYYAAN